MIFFLAHLADAFLMRKPVKGEDNDCDYVDDDDMSMRKFTGEISSRCK